MRIKFYLKRPILSKKSLAKRGQALKLFESGAPISEVMKLTKHKDPEKCKKYLSTLKDKGIDDDSNANQPTAIFALVNYNGNTLKVYTGESIIPKYWNPETNYARNTPKFTEHSEFNARLDQIKSAINRAYLDYKNRNDGADPSPAIFKPLIEAALNRNVQKTTFLDYFEDFIRRTEAGGRINYKSKFKKPVKSGVAKYYTTTLNHLKDFAGKWKRTLDFDTIDLDFHKDFTEYLTSTGKREDPKTKKEKPLHLSANSIGVHIQRLKSVLYDATENGHNKNLIFQHERFSKQSEEADTIYLNESELKEMQKLDLTENPRLERVRDLFLVGANTGLRISDLSLLRASHIEDGFIKITQTKTGKPVIIPVHPIVKGILKKYNGELPKSISGQKFNDYLKEIGKRIASLNKKASKTITKGGTTITKTFKKWELLSSHAARRSFATNSYKAGVPTITIMAVTGHKTESSFLRYIRVTSDEHARKLQDHWYKDQLKAV